MRFSSGYGVGVPFGDYDQDTVKNEPMFFSSSIDFAKEYGGPITKGFLETFENFEKNYWYQEVPELIFDSRVHMLMPGWFPCIPGFHHDDVPRGANGQPDYENMAYKSKHCFGLVNGDIAPTEFALGEINLDIPDGIIYKTWHLEVEKAIAEGWMARSSVPSNRLIFFDWQDFHQGVRANAFGWRWFGRLSWNTDRKIFNEIRQQVQVYLEYPMEGW